VWVKKSPLRFCRNFSKTVGNFSTKLYTPITCSHLRYTANFYSNTCNFDEDMPYKAWPPSSHYQNVHHRPKRTLAFSGIFSQTVRNFCPKFTCLLNIHIYARMQIFIQLSPTTTKLCHIKCDHPACASVDGGHFEHIMVTLWSRLIWNNFVKVAGNWTKVCSPV